MAVLYYNIDMPETPSTIWPWLRERLFPRGTMLIQWAAYVIVITMLVLQVIQPEDRDPFRFNTTLLALSVLLVINILWDDLQNRFASEQTGIWVLLLISTGLAFYAILVGRMFNAIYIIFMIIAQANAMLPARPALAYSAVLAGGYMSAAFASVVQPADAWNFSISVLIGLTFTITLIQVLNRYEEQRDDMRGLLEALRQTNAALLESQAKEKELTIAEERVRMARDLHDGLGHHLTALSIQLQAAEKMIKSNPALAEEALSNARGTVKAALKEVRGSVAVLREAPVDFSNLPGAVEQLVKETARLSGLAVRFEQQGETAALSPAAAMTLYRTAQEGLTNVIKHAAGASQVLVRLGYDPNVARLAVEDNGTVLADWSYQENAGRFGLAGLRERAGLLGGSLECGPIPTGGFRVEVVLPRETQPRQPQLPGQPGQPQQPGLLDQGGPTP